MIGSCILPMRGAPVLQPQLYFLIQDKDGVGILVIMIIMMLVFVGQFGDNNNNNGDDNDDDDDNNNDNDDIRWSACVIRHPSIA